MNHANSYRVLLYYKFVEIPNHEVFAQEHLKMCKDLNLRGRILVANEGINGTVSGTIEDTEDYMRLMKHDPKFTDLIFKIEETEGHAFKKMFVRPRRSLISLYEEDEINPNELTGTHLKPKAFYEALQEDEVIIIDGRNDYEYEIGHFRGAIKPEVKSFREFPEWINNTFSEEDKNKKVLTYCTGGIRCEKLTGVLMKSGFKDVNQLDGGIITYGQDQEINGRLFDGKCYVFDERISVKINRTEEDVIISNCVHCGQPSDRYINCANDDCHIQHISCEDCESIHHSLCGTICREYVLKNPHRHRQLKKGN